MPRSQKLTPPEGFTVFTGGRAHADWPEIDASLLEEGRVQAPAFPLQFLPPAWERWVADTLAAQLLPAH